MDRDDVVDLDAGARLDAGAHLDQVAAETLHQGRERQARRSSTRALLVVAGLVVAALLLDRSVHEREVEALLVDVEAAATAVERADTRITAMQLYLRPVAASGASTSALATDLDGLVAEAAGQGAEEVRSRRADLHDSPVLPWHHDVRAARAAVRAYLDTQVERLASARVSDQPTEDAALVDAAAALRAVAPTGTRADRLEVALRTLPGGRARG